MLSLGVKASEPITRADATPSRLITIPSETGRQGSEVRLEATRRETPQASSAMPVPSAEPKQSATLRLPASASIEGKSEPLQQMSSSAPLANERPAQRNESPERDPTIGNGNARESAPKLPNRLQTSGGSLLSSSPEQPIMVASSSLSELQQLVVIAKDIQQAEAQRRFLSGQGVGVVSRKNLQNLGFVQTTFQYREPHTAESLLELLRTLDPEILAEQNQRYRLQTAGEPISANKAIGHALTKLSAPTSCRSDASIAMLDSTVLPDALESQEGKLFVYSPLSTENLPANHGTSVANLLISDSAQFPGLLKNVALHAIGIFDLDTEGQPETRTDWIIAGLDILAGITPAPKVVNLSFGGAYSALLASIYQRLSTRFIFVAAAGNSGTSEKLYPAGYEAVVAVGAFNSKGQPYALSNTGSHIQVWGPGEDIWTRNEKGKGYYAYGTSFAAPFVTAALLMVLEKNGSVSDYLASLGADKHLNFSTLCDESEFK